MSKSSKPRVVAIAASVLAAAVAVAITAVTGAVAPLFFLAVLGVGALGVVQVSRKGAFPAGVRWAGLFGGIAASGIATTLDHSVLSGVAVLIAVALVGLVWMSVAKQLAPAETLSGATQSALAKAGVQMAEESAGGWRMGATADGVVVMIREIAEGKGAVGDWKSVADAASSTDAALKVLASQGIKPLVLAVVNGAEVGPSKVSGMTVCSVSKIASAIRAAGSSVVDPTALLGQAGIVPNRAAARAVSRSVANSPAAKKRSGSGKVVHQGRVTKKAD